MSLTRPQLFQLAHALGHTNPAVFETSRGRFFSTCSCGYASVTKNTFVDALSSGVHHALTEAIAVERSARTAGRPLNQAIARYKATEHSWSNSGATGTLVTA